MTDREVSTEPKWSDYFTLRNLREFATDFIPQAFLGLVWAAYVTDPVLRYWPLFWQNFVTGFLGVGFVWLNVRRVVRQTHQAQHFVQIHRANDEQARSISAVEKTMADLTARIGTLFAQDKDRPAVRQDFAELTKLIEKTNAQISEIRQANAQVKSFTVTTGPSSPSYHPAPYEAYVRSHPAYSGGETLPVPAPEDKKQSDTSSEAEKKNS